MHRLHVIVFADDDVLDSVVKKAGGAKGIVGTYFTAAFDTDADAGKIDSIMDKTGTITKGVPEVTDVIPSEIAEDELIAVAAGLEQGSEHPLAEAVVRMAEERNIKAAKAADFAAVFGRGVKAKDEAGAVLIAGNAQIMEEEGIDVSTVADELGSLADQGKTPLIFARGGRLIGVIAAADQEKKTSLQAIRDFKAMNRQRSRTRHRWQQRFQSRKDIVQLRICCCSQGL